MSLPSEIRREIYRRVDYKTMQNLLWTCSESREEILKLVHCISIKALTYFKLIPLLVHFLLRNRGVKFLKSRELTCYVVGLRNNIEILELLASAGLLCLDTSNRNVLDSSECLSVSLPAFIKGDIKAIAWLYEHGKDIMTWESLMILSSNGHLEVIKEIILKYPYMVNTNFCRFAVETKNLFILDLIIEKTSLKFTKKLIDYLLMNRLNDYVNKINPFILLEFSPSSPLQKRKVSPLIPKKKYHNIDDTTEKLLNKEIGLCP